MYVVIYISLARRGSMRLIVYLMSYMLMMVRSAATVDAPTTDSRWLLVPERNIDVVIGTRISLFWRYKHPGINQKTYISFSHHQLGYSYETLLIRAEVDPVTGSVSIGEVLYPDRLILYAVPGNIRVSFNIESIEDSGRYILDVKFDDKLPIHDLVNVVVYKQPRWLQIPETETLVTNNEPKTFTWRLSTGVTEPRVQSVTVIRQNGNLSDVVLELERTYESNGWMKRYDEQVFDNVIFDVNKEASVMTLILWQLMESGSGCYVIKVTFYKRIFELEHKIWVYVSRGYDWLLTPPNHIYTLQSRDLRLVYYVKFTNTTSCPVRIVLLKTPETEVISLVHNDGSREGNEKRLRTIPDTAELGPMEAFYDDKNSKITFWIQDVSKNTSGYYEVRVYVSEQPVLSHNVVITVLSATDIEMLFRVEETSLEGNNGSYEIIPCQLVIISPSGVPWPDVELYSLKEGYTQLYVKGFNVSFLEVMITDRMLENGDLTLGAYYGFAHKIYRFRMADGILAASASLFGVVVLIICAVILLSLIAVVVVRYRRRKTKHHRLVVTPGVSINKHSGCKQRCPPDAEEKTSWMLHQPDSRNTSQDYSSSRLSPAFKQRTSVESDRQSRNSKCSRTSTSSSRNSKTTFMVHAVYIKKEENANKELPVAATLNRSLSTASSSASSNLDVLRRILNISHPDKVRQVTRRPRVTSTRAKSQDFELGSNEVFCPETGNSVDKHKSVSNLIDQCTGSGDGRCEPQYRIHRATDNRYQDTLPAFLVRYNIKKDNTKDVIERDSRRDT